MKHKVSVITVVLNDVKHIRQTMESFFAQTWQEKEYIVIDGGSTDGTCAVIEEYADRLAYWVSEKDGGLYEAMNKGIVRATGEWICVLNSGDTFASSSSLSQAILRTEGIDTVDVIYGDSIERSLENGDVYQEASDRIELMEHRPVYRHGSSLVRASVQKSHLYDVAKQQTYGFALDWLLIHQLYREGYVFRKTDAIIETFVTEGLSNNRVQSLRYNRMVVTGRPMGWLDEWHVRLSVLKDSFKKTAFYHWAVAFLTEYMLNDILPHVPFWSIRRMVMRRLNMKIGQGTFLMKHIYVMTPQKLSIGQYSHINRGCTLDARGSIKIGNNVSVSHDVKLMSGSHDHNSPEFRGRFLPIRIGDYVWIGVGATILQQVEIGEGAVVCAGAVVTRDVEPYSVVAGVPARKIGERNKTLNYQCKGQTPFT